MKEADLSKRKRLHRLQKWNTNSALRSLTQSQKPQQQFVNHTLGSHVTTYVPCFLVPVKEINTALLLSMRRCVSAWMRQNFFQGVEYAGKDLQVPLLWSNSHPRGHNGFMLDTNHGIALKWERSRRAATGWKDCHKPAVRGPWLGST